MSEAEEEWRPIHGHPDYEVSDWGRVRCCARRRYLKPGQLVSLVTLNTGYRSARLDGWPYSVHRLVCFAFHGDPPSSTHQVAHNDGVRSNNVASNLRWATCKENHADIKKHGTANPPRGEMQGGSKLTAKDIPVIRSLRANGLMQKEIAAIYGVSRGAINNILNGPNWRHI